jgi:2-dehydro-3-deoxyphosphooctonate aldolase (KDO 8-P synthase)
MNNKIINIGSKFDIGNDKPFFLMAGPCQLEDLDHALMMAEGINKICEKLGINYVFKASFDKANRTGVNSKRGPGFDKGMRVFEEVKKQVGVPVITDVHTMEQAQPTAEVVDILQVPAFLCRQSDLLEAIAKAGKPIHIKKMQQLAPWTMQSTVEKINHFGNNDVILCERGAMFGYGTLVNDIRGLPIMAQWAPVTIDCTHSCQLPGGSVTGGNREMAPVIAAASVAVGVAGIFAEVHQDPDKAPSDSANMIRLSELEGVLKRLVALDKVAKTYPLNIRNYTILG